MNEAIRIAEQMLTEADGLMCRAKKLIEAEEEAKRKRRDEMDALDALIYSAQKCGAIMVPYKQGELSSQTCVAVENLRKTLLNISPKITPSDLFTAQKMGCAWGFPASCFPAPKVPNPEQKTVEVKRHAKVGETIKIVKPQYQWNCTVTDYAIGDTFTVSDAKSTNGVRITSKRDKPMFVHNSEYVVLEPAPIKPEVGMWVRRKHDGKMLCVLSTSNAEERVIYVSEIEGCTMKAEHNVTPFTQEWDILHGGDYTIVPNYAPTPADMLEVIQ